MKPDTRRLACACWWPTSPPPRASSEPASKQFSEGQYFHLATTSFPHHQLNSFPQVPAFRELAKLGHSERCNSTFLLVEAKPSYHLLNSTMWGNYTWPAWLCTQSTCESTPLFQFKPPLVSLALFRFQNRFSQLPHSGEAHCKIHPAWLSSRSPLSSSCLRSILAPSRVSSQSESQDGPLKTFRAQTLYQK